MNPETLIQNPEYLSLLMILASGYALNFILFSNSKKWKDSLDSPMKMILGLVTGFGIELCIIIPIFFLLFPNASQFGLSINTFNLTWMAHTGLTLIISLLTLQKKQDAFKWLKFVSKVFFVFFVFVLLSFIVVNIEYFLYSDFILGASIRILDYFSLNLFFFSIGIIFMFYFVVFSGKTIEEAFLGTKEQENILDEINFDRESLKNAFKKFYKSRKPIWLKILFFVLILISLVIPVDLFVHAFNPNVRAFNDVQFSAEPVQMLSLSIFHTGYFEAPEVSQQYSVIRRDSYEITPAYYDILNSVVIPIEPKLKNKYATVVNNNGSFYDIDQLRIYLPFEERELIEVTPVSSEFDGLKFLNITYSEENNEPRNITLIYFNKVKCKIQANTFAPTGTPFNETYETWKQEIEFFNNSTEKIFFDIVSYDIFVNEGNQIDKESIVVEWNGTQVTNQMLNFEKGTFDLMPRYLYPNEKVKVTISFLSTNRFPK